MLQKTIATLYAVTHTETFYNRRRIFTGRLNSNLTPRGHRQAQKLTQELRRKKIDFAFISPLDRSKQTLAHIRKYHPNLEIRIDKRLAERNYGQLARKSKVKFRKLYPELYEQYHRSYHVPPPGGESMIVVEKRVRAFLKDTIAFMKKNKTNVLVIAHNNSIRPIRRFFEKLSPAQMMKSDNHKQVFVYQIPVD